MSGKYSQKRFDYAKQSATDALKWVIQEIAQPTSDLIGNTIANKIMKVSRSSSQNNPKTVTNENDKEVHKEQHISLEERHYWLSSDII